MIRIAQKVELSINPSLLASSETPVLVSSNAPPKKKKKNRWKPRTLPSLVLASNHGLDYHVDTLHARATTSLSANSLLKLFPLAPPD
jgi:hypothetical protein